MNDFIISAGRALLGTFGAAAILAAAPAQAETSDTVEMVAKTDLPTKGSMGAALGSGEAHDEQFRQLFASWDKMDRAQAGVLTTTVAVPSRMPLENARLSSDFGTRIHPVLGRRAGHKGVDLAAPTGSPATAITSRSSMAPICRPASPIFPKSSFRQAPRSRRAI